MKIFAKDQGGFFWKKIAEAKESGLTGEEITQIEEIEAIVAQLENKLEECLEEIKRIKREAKSRKRKG